MSPLPKAKRGIFFTLDAVFGILILVTLFSVFMLLSVETVSTEEMHQLLRFQAEDAIVVLAKTKLSEVRYLPIVQEMEEQDILVQVDDDYSIMEVVGSLWATNDTGNMTRARELVRQVLGPSMPPNLNWKVTAGNDTVFSTGDMSKARFMSAVSNRMVSGYMKGKPRLGYSARVFLSNIQGKSESAYVFFGGFVGQGEITGVLRDIPADAEITEMYMEASSGANFTLYINNTKCSDMNWTEDGYGSWDISACNESVNKGAETTVYAVFDSENITTRYFGGGYLRVTYKTATMKPIAPTKMRYYFPGIEGIINIYDAFFVPGDIQTVTAWLNISSNYSTYLRIGNATIFQRAMGQGTDFEQYTIASADILNNLSVNSLSFPAISNSTVPIRFGTPEATFVFGGRESDVILVNDVSGSMALCMDQDDATCDSCGISPGWCDHGASGESCGYEGSFFDDDGTILCSSRLGSANCTMPENEKKIEALKTAILGSPPTPGFLHTIFDSSDGSRIGIVDYSSPKEGNVVLPDIGVSEVRVEPNVIRPRTPYNYTFYVNVTNYGFAPTTRAFTTVIFSPSMWGDVLPPINFSVEPPLNPGETIALNKTLELAINSSGFGSIYAWADCGGNFSAMYQPALNGTCPPEADGFGLIEEYTPYYDGNYGWLAAVGDVRINNYNSTTWEMGVDLFPAINNINSTPFNLTHNWYDSSEKAWKRRPLICTSNTRDPYNQTMHIQFNLTNTGVLNMTNSFEVDLRRWNAKCNQYESVGIKNNLGWVVPGECAYIPSELVGGIGYFFCQDLGNPVTFKSLYEWSGYNSNYAPYTTVFPANKTFVFNYTWDVENYTSTLGAACDDFNTSDPANEQYEKSSDFDLIVAVDPKEEAPEGDESNNNATWRVYREKPDMYVQLLNYRPPERCSSTVETTKSCKTNQAVGCSDRAGNRYCDVKPGDYDWAADQSLMNVTIHMNNYCPVFEPFNISFWTEDDWCLNGSDQFQGCCDPVPNGCGFTQDCSPVYRGSCLVPFNLGKTITKPEYNYQGYEYDCGTIGTPLPLYVLYRDTDGGASCDTYVDCTLKARSVGNREVTARIDNTWVPVCGIGDCFENRTDGSDFASAVGEMDEYNNIEDGNITENFMPDFLSSIQCLPPAEQYRYGYGPIDCTVCFSNASAGADWPYVVNRTVSLSNAMYHCTALGWRCWPSAEGFNVSLYGGCTSCSPTPTGCTDNFGQNKLTAYWNGNCYYWPGGYTKNTTWPSVSMNFTDEYTFCSLADESQKYAEASETNNAGTLTFKPRPTDLEATNAYFISSVYPNYFSVDGVTKAANGTMHTCYGAKTAPAFGGGGWPIPYETRYWINTYFNNSGPCSMWDDVTLRFGTTEPVTGTGTYYFSYYGPGTYGHQQGVYMYGDYLVNHTVSLSNAINPTGLKDLRSILWNGTTPDGQQDYEKYFDEREINMFFSVNEPLRGVNYNYPAETNWQNNWYTNATRLAIHYEAPELAIYQLNITNVSNVYTIRIGVLNNDTSPGKCRTGLQAPFEVGLYENASTFNPDTGVLVNSSTVDNVDANTTYVVNFTYVAEGYRLMSIKIDYDKTNHSYGDVFELNENNNWQTFEVTIGGGAEGPEKVPELLLKGQSSSSLLLSEADSLPAASLAGTGGPVTGECTVKSVVPNDAVGPFNSTITVESTLNPQPLSCTITCGQGDVKRVPLKCFLRPSGIGGGVGLSGTNGLSLEGANLQVALACTAIDKCEYPAVGVDTRWNGSAKCGTTSCGSFTVWDRAVPPVCTNLIVADTSGEAPHSTQVDAYYEDNVGNPLVGVSVQICCNGGSDCGNYLTNGAGVATRTCNYASAGSYSVTSSYSSATCTPVTVTVTEPPKSCSLSANPGSGEGSFNSTITLTGVNIPTGTGCSLNCYDGSGATGLTMEADNTVENTCTYPSISEDTVWNVTATCDAGTVTCTPTTVSATVPLTPYCTTTASPSSAKTPFYSTITTSFYNTVATGSVQMCCDGSLNCTSVPISGNSATRSCFYGFSGTYYPTSTKDALVCADMVYAQPSQWESYICPHPLDDHLLVNLSAYKDFPMYNDSIIARLDLTNNTGQDAIYDHVENSTQTLHGTCTCCGILEAVDMMGTDQFRLDNPGRPGSVVVMSDGIPTEGCAHLSSKFPGAGLTGDPVQDTIQSACFAHSINYNLTVFTIAFGQLANATLMNLTAQCGGGELYLANDSASLIAAYEVIADRILNLSYSSQSIQIVGEGFTNSTLDENSYLEFTFLPYFTDFGWNDVTISMETPDFLGCTGAFNISDRVEVYSAVATSYSDLYWTRQLFANALTAYDIADFCPLCNSYKEMGDPFNIEFEPGLLSTTSENQLQYVLGNVPGDSDGPCGSHNKIIYKAKFAAAVPFSDILPLAEGKNVKVYYDLDADHIAEGYVVIPIAEGIVGIPFVDITLTPTELLADAETNALANSTMELLTTLNYFPNPASSDPAGSQSNPIDVKIDPKKVVFRASSIYDVPYMWGPVDMGVIVWVE